MIGPGCGLVNDCHTGTGKKWLTLNYVLNVFFLENQDEKSSGIQESYKFSAKLPTRWCPSEFVS